MLYRLMVNAQLKIMEFKNDSRGVTAVEYAIIAVAMSALVLAVYTNGDVSEALSEAMEAVKANITAAKTVPTP